jgi:hypothetical protein
MNNVPPETPPNDGDTVDDVLTEPLESMREQNGDNNVSTAEQGEDEIDEAAENKYWRKHFQELGYVNKTDDYELFEAAFRTGYVARRTYRGKTFEQVEDELRLNYEASAGPDALGWDRAVCAACDAWNHAGKG